MPSLDEGFEPLPALTEPPAAEDELSLQDALADGPVIPTDSDPPVPLGRAPAYDFDTRRLRPGAAGGPLMTLGVETLATWVQKALLTRRAQHPAVDPNFGCDILAEDLLEEGAPFDAAAVAEYMAAVERALLIHPRIASVDDIEIDGDPDDDRVFISFRVELSGDDVETLTFDRLAVGG